VGGGTERYHFYSGRRSFIGSEGSQAVYYLSSRHVRLEASEKKVRGQGRNSLRIQKGIKFAQSLFLDRTEKFKPFLTENRVHLYCTDQPATAILGKLL